VIGDVEMLINIYSDMDEGFKQKPLKVYSIVIGHSVFFTKRIIIYCFPLVVKGVYSEF